MRSRSDRASLLARLSNRSPRRFLPLPLPSHPCLPSFALLQPLHTLPLLPRPLPPLLPLRNRSRRCNNLFL